MNRLFRKLLSTHAGLMISFLRIWVGFIFLKAGAGKLWGSFGGPGIGKVLDSFQKLHFPSFAPFHGMGIPYVEFSTYLTAYTELLMGIALILGLFTRLAAIPCAFIMVVAALTAHWSDTFLGLDSHFYYVSLLFGIFLVLIERGAGILSLDRLFVCFWKNQESSSTVETR